MPNHQDNSVGHMVRRIRRWLRQGRAAGRNDWTLPVSAPEGSRDLGAERPLTTLDATIRPVGSGRYRRLAWAPGEPHLLCTDLGVAPADDRAATRRSLLYIGHHTDTHVCDAQSPARLEGGETFGWFNPGADGGHRPQELCTTHVLDQLVVATNAVAASPVTGAPMAWCAQTGDNTDNRTEAEVAWWLGVLEGHEVTPNTGAPGRYEGVQRSGWRGVWHPDDPSHDIYGDAGFPALPGFLDAAVAPFQPTGLTVPWLAVFGNHDVLYQGTFGSDVAKVGDLLASASAKPRGTIGLIRTSLHTRLLGGGRARWERLRRGPGIQRVAADPEARRSVPLDDFLRKVVDAGDHGFTAANLEEGTSWWSRPEGDQVQVLGLDTCNHAQGSGGSLGPRQTQWLELELQRHHRRWRDPQGRWVQGDGADRLVVILSHHNSWTMDNGHDDPADPGPRTSGPDLVALLTRYPNVVVWINGHSHEHKILVHRGFGRGAGCWEIDTASAIDFSQQGRTFELLDNGDGTVSILVTVLDHAGAPATDHRTDDRWTVAELASISRELAANDDRWIDPIALLGRPEDRNVELVVAAPFPLR
ncbi:TIGR03767 family metallophosphoesterase [Aquihabitans sp. McL0605]|uniref:TIGR03767 family metallophosphoesterase n=1 Tax=Aquihabitans sp. McL0605 TaxID=3415671 RepID=UPI003CEBD368